MTKERKASATWYIATTHYLTAGFAIPFIANLAIGFILAPLFGPGTLTTLALSLVIGAAAVWFGVVYSASFLEKTYIIPDSKRVITLATTYYAVLNILFTIGVLFIPSDTEAGTTAAFIFSTIMTAVGMAVFYVASKRFVNDTSAGLV